MVDRLEAWGERTVGDVVAEDYRRAAVFKTFGIDFCCGGGRSLRSACEASGADYEEVARALSAADRSVSGEGGADDPSSDPMTWELDRLADHIVDVHHGYVRRTIPVLRDFTTKVARVHGGRHPELEGLRQLTAELTAELERHMEDEERDLFPRIAALVATGSGGGNGGGMADGEARGVRSATIPLEDDHDHAGELMRRIRALSDDFTPPADACTTYRATFAKLAEFEEDLHRHVHLENNVLFPRAAAAEAGVAAGTGA